MNVNSLDELLSYITENEVDERTMTELPTFGGETPANTELVWSWDEQRLLVGTCRDDFEIVNRV